MSTPGSANPETETPISRMAFLGGISCLSSSRARKERSSSELISPIDLLRIIGAKSEYFTLSVAVFPRAPVVGTTRYPLCFCFWTGERKTLEVHGRDLCAHQRWFGDPSSPCGCFFDHSSRGPQESETDLVALAAPRSKTRSRSKCERGNRLYNRWLDRGAPLAPWSIRLNIRKTVLSHAGRHAESPKTG
jgi:hypothetical protein